MEADFKYQPLQHSSHIRLLIVLPGEIEDPLFCVILHVGLDNLGKSGLIRFRDTTSNDIGVPDGYDALSYAWGDPKLPKKTMKLAYNQPCIADIERNRHLFANMSITPSLESALKQLRNKDMRNVKWADAVCINQADRAEKEREILKMASIYSSATRVLVWLGLTYEPDYDPPTMAEIPGDEAVWAAFGWFIRINQACTDQECHALDLDVVTNLPALAPSQQEFEGMRILFNRPWFRRVWIVQEVVLAKGPTWILCGKRGQRIELALNSAFFIYKYVTHTAQFGVRNVVSAVSSLAHTISRFRNFRFRGYTLPEKTLNALFATAGLHVTVKADRLYGMLSIIGDVSEVPELMPDYTKPIDTFFKNLARYLVEATRTAVLTQAWNGNSKGRPSWIPTWDHTTRNPFVPYQRARERTTVSISECGQYLYVNALVVGRICFSTPFKLESLDSESLKTRLSALENIFSRSRSASLQSRTGAQFPDLVVGRLFINLAVASTPHKDLLELYRIFIGCSTWPGSLCCPSEDQAEDEARLLVIIKTVIRNGVTLFVTSAGQVGLSSQVWNIQNNDMIFWIAGCTQPQIFRQEAPGFKIVGRCEIDEYHDLASDEHYEILDKGTWQNITII